MRKPYRSANPAVWGAVLAIIIGVAAVLGAYWGAPPSPNTLLATPAKAAGTAFAFGSLAAMFRNWFNERNRPGR